MSEINIVPLIDVMLVLLIVSMVTVPLLNQGIEVNLPQDSSGALEEYDEDPLVVTVRADKRIYVNVGVSADFDDDSFISFEEMEERTSKVLSARPNVPVFVRGDQDLDYGYVMQVNPCTQRSRSRRCRLGNRTRGDLAPMQWIKTYGVPLSLALVLHAAALLFQFALADGLKIKPDERILEPRVVRATLIVLDMQESSTEMVAPPTLSPMIPLPETVSTPTAEEEKNILDELDVTEESQKRLETLEELRDSTLEDDISDTIQSLAELALDEESATYVKSD